MKCCNSLNDYYGNPANREACEEIRARLDRYGGKSRQYLRNIADRLPRCRTWFTGTTKDDANGKPRPLVETCKAPCCRGCNRHQPPKRGEAIWNRLPAVAGRHCYGEFVFEIPATLAGFNAMMKLRGSVTESLRKKGAAGITSFVSDSEVGDQARKVCIRFLVTVDPDCPANIVAEFDKIFARRLKRGRHDGHHVPLRPATEADVIGMLHTEPVGTDWDAAVDWMVVTRDRKRFYCDPLHRPAMQADEQHDSANYRAAAITGPEHPRHAKLDDAQKVYAEQVERVERNGREAPLAWVEVADGLPDWQQAGEHARQHGADTSPEVAEQAVRYLDLPHDERVKAWPKLPRAARRTAKLLEQGLGRSTITPPIAYELSTARRALERDVPPVRLKRTRRRPTLFVS